VHGLENSVTEPVHGFSLVALPSAEPAVAGGVIMAILIALPTALLNDRLAVMA